MKIECMLIFLNRITLINSKLVKGRQYKNKCCFLQDTFSKRENEYIRNEKAY
jgi:hypothetical protein